MHPLQLEIYRRMTPEKKLRAAGQLYETAWELKRAGLEMQHPDWDEARLRDEVRRIFLRAHT